MLGVVTTTVNRPRAEPCFASWKQHATADYPLVVIENGQDGAYLGPVGACHVGVEMVMKQHPDCDVIAVFHDDLVILDHGWDQVIDACFGDYPAAGLASFGGWLVLTEQLEGEGAVGHAEAQPIVAPLACALIARRVFWSGFTETEWRTKETRRKVFPRPWSLLDRIGIVDHVYAGALGCLARRGGWQVRYLPVRYRHLGGQTTAHDGGYQAWAAAQIAGGTSGFKQAGQRIAADTFRDELPLRLAD